MVCSWDLFEVETISCPKLSWSSLSSYLPSWNLIMLFLVDQLIIAQFHKTLSLFIYDRKSELFIIFDTSDSTMFFTHPHTVKTDDIKWASVRWRQEIRLLFVLQDQKFVASNINQLKFPSALRSSQISVPSFFIEQTRYLWMTS